MPSGYRRRFFEGVKDHSEIKLRALARYLRPWAEKVGSRRTVKRIWVVDAFAGAGEYADGRLGSPGLALTESERLRLLKRPYKLSCYFVEKDSTNHAKLRRLVSKFPGVEVILPEPKDFWCQIDNVVAMVAEDPVFLFVDPFGLGDLKFDPLSDLCNRLQQVDLMVNLASPAARRLEPRNADLVSAAVGGPGWNVDNISEVFCQRLGERCRFLRPASLPVEGSFGGLKYEVILAARHPAAYELWNDEIADGDRGILASSDDKAIWRRVEEAKTTLKEAVRGRPRFQRDNLLRHIATENCGEAHRSIYLRAVKSLVESGEWLQDPGPVGTSWTRVAR
jgi:three-Cys-motif partner protein